NCGQNVHFSKSRLRSVVFELHTIVLTSETDAQELIGSYEQIVDDSALIDAKAALSELLEKHVDADVLNKLNAADDVTHAAVLDRLNSCLESDGRLVVSERQSSFDPLKPHQNFRRLPEGMSTALLDSSILGLRKVESCRAFLSMDARNGEISRAMRNRSVEIFVTTHQQWNSSPPDITAVLSSHGKIIPQKLSKSLSSLPAEKQLHFSALLSEMSIEEACRIIGLPYSETADVALCHSSIAPFVEEVDTEGYESWLLRAWKECSDIDPFSGLFLSLLSTSTSVLRGVLFQQVFGDTALPAVSRLRKMSLDMEHSHHPIDPRFHHGIPGSEGSETVRRFVVVTVCEWFICFLKASTIYPQSAEHLSRTLSKFEMTRLDVSFKNLQLIAKVVDAVIDTLNEASQVGDENKVYMFCLHLALFVIASRRPLDARTGCAPLYLAWNEIHRLLPRPTVVDSSDTLHSDSSVLSKLIHLMSEGWSVDAHDRFIKSYLPFYEAHRVAEPFSDEEGCQKLCSVITYVPSENGAGDVRQLRSPTEDIEEVIPAVPNESPISKALNLISLMRQLYIFLSTGVVDEPNRTFDSLLVLKSIPWRNELCRKFAQGIALLNSEYSDAKKVSSLRFTDAFSTIFLSFWEDVDFDPQLSSLSVSHLMHCELMNLVQQLWKLAPNSPVLSQLITEELRSANNGLTGSSVLGDQSDDGWKRRLDVALEIMQNALPPPDTLDPVIFEEQRAAYQQNVFQAVDRPLDVLAKWRNAVSRQPPECDSHSSHPVIACLWNTRSELKIFLDKSHEKPAVFRQKASQYSSMCDEMRAFYGVVATIVPVLRGLSADADVLRSDFDSRQLTVILAQLHSFAISAHGFKKRILTTFGSFVDVSMTFVQGLDVFLCGLHEACDLIETAERRRDLQSSTAFPIRFSVKATAEGLESTELLSWCCRDASPMPLHLKAAVVRRRLASGDDPICNLEWIRHQWQKWYEKNVAKAVEKDFVYRNKTEEEKDELDVMEFFSERDQEREILSDITLRSLLETNRPKTGSKTSTDAQSAADSNYVLALLWLRHVLTGVRRFDQELHSSIVDSDFLLIGDLVEKIMAGSDAVLDVYRSASLAQFRRAAEILEPLAKRTRVIMERWPEVFISAILFLIFQFASEQCEEWEKMADRMNSLRHELAPLRELLVDWKKMEVRSWGELLRRVENDGQLRAQLVVYPLFDALFKAETSEAQTALIAMSTEWISNASLLDYSIRIKSVHCLAEWAELLGYNSVSLQLHSMAAHFEQYTPVVEQSLREAREPAEHALKDYVKIVKFNDLNLWNIKVSSQKAHTHLYKIVRKFREAVGVQVSPHFDKLVQIGGTSAAALPDLSKVEAHGRGRRAVELADVIMTQAASVCDVMSAVELADQTKCCDEAIRVLINYQGEDEEKEKQQGYARNSRQRAVAMVIKEAQSIGLNARKAQVLDPEILTRSSLTEVRRNHANETSVHICAGGRNACIRKAVAPNDQLGVATRKHLVGVIDYGMAWILKCHKKLADWEDSCGLLTRKSRAFERLQSNVEVEKKNYFFFFFGLLWCFKASVIILFCGRNHDDIFR
ncbi:hypothetical protein COOONC_15592, partial [Cooperia oncophora]